MKMIRITILIAILFLVACDKPEDTRHLPDGLYQGVFKRYNQPESQEVEVSMRFVYPSWEGSSTVDKYPALGKGKFNLENGSLRFDNETAWTADFDWTLILDGVYLEHSESDSLVFTRSYPNGWVDVYRLKKVH